MSDDPQNPPPPPPDPPVATPVATPVAKPVAKSTPPPAPGATIDEGEDGDPTILERGLPWLVSAVAHAVLVLATVFIVWTTVVAPDDEEIIIPSLDFNPNATPQLQQSEVQRLERNRPQRRRTVQRTQRLTELTRNVGATDQLLQEALSEPDNPFSDAADEAAQFNTTFFGARGNARRIVFVIDASGSVIDVFHFIKRELQRSINRLSEQQEFHIILSQGGRPVEMAPAQWKRATSANKAAAIDWIEKQTATDAGSNQRAIEVALRYRPQLMFLLSDEITGRGRFETPKDLLIDAIDQANAAGTKINTVQFVYPDPLTAFGQTGTMEAIAESFGGVYRFVSEEDLRLR
ncbi:MAG: vWA domain-containing protein [Planctomycetota bacterium]